MDVGLATLPMNKMLWVVFSQMKTKKGRLSFMTSGMLMGMTSMVVLAAAVVPSSSTLTTARWDTCGRTRRKGFIQRTGLPFATYVYYLVTFETLSLVSSDIPEKSAWSEKASAMPISFSVLSREASTLMENFGIDRSTELRNRRSRLESFRCMMDSQHAQYGRFELALFSVTGTLRP